MMNAQRTSTPLLVPQELLLEREPARESAESTVIGHDAMAGNEERNWIRVQRTPNCARR